MKRNPKSKRVTPRITSAKKQKSIMSFFQTRVEPITPLSQQKPASNFSSLKRQSPPTGSTPSLKTRSASNDASNDLRRELFSEPEQPRPVKRRRVLRLEDFSDDEEDVPLMSLESPQKGEPQEHAIDNSKDEDEPISNMLRTENVKGSDSSKASKVGDVKMMDREDQDAETSVDIAEREKALGETVCEFHTADGKYNFKALMCPNQTERQNPVPTTVLPDSKERREARKKLAALADTRAVGDEEGGWCQRHPWSVDIRDTQKRRPSDPNYDKTTLFVPRHLLMEGRGGTKGGSLSPFQRQFWSIKSVNYDVVIFFKKGKFYELYDKDADIGNEQLGLNYTKGGRVDMRCCGVPEQALDKHCGRLVDLGYKVGRVEQTETANAAEKRKNGSGSNKSTVCERSLVRILTKATVNDEGLLRDHRARYVIAIAEKQDGIHQGDSGQSTGIKDEGTSCGEDQPRTVGVCYVDVAGGSISIEEYKDDLRLARTERLLTFLRPQEIIVNLKESSGEMNNLVKWTENRNEAEVINLGLKRGIQPMTEPWLAQYLDPRSSHERKEEFDRVWHHLGKYKLCGLAFGAMAAHLKSLIIDKETLSIGNYTLSPSSSDSGTKDAMDSNEINHLAAPGSKHLRMDAPTLQNLEILSSSIDNSERGALLSFVDRAHTPAGRRLIRKWIAEPLVLAEEIEDRLQAIQDIHALEDLDGGRTLNDIIRQLKTKKDLERALPKLHQQATINHSAVMFDDTNRRRVREFLVIIFSLRSSLKAVDTLRGAVASCPLKSQRLAWLHTVGCGIPSEAASKLDYFLSDAFDVSHAESCGEILPKPGAVPSYDTAKDELDTVESALNAELERWKSRLGDPAIKFYHRGKEPYQIEMKVGTLHGRTPNEFEVVSESKTTKRFYTSRIKSLVKKQVEASEAYEDASSSVARDMMQQFDKEYNTWSLLSSTCAELDALIGLAFASRDEGSGPMCRPQILSNSHPEPIFKAEGLRHPILANSSTSFVSNDVSLGGSVHPDIMVLTGPNAGGKSTLARQVALGVILAQMGCFVPAKSFCIRPFEDIYVRMGASDDLARGRSTFMVEMEEVSNILNNANSKSLIIADEVGRGTSTHDGYAVAHASLDHIARVNKSLTVFSTHYSHLGEDVVTLERPEGRAVAGMFEMGALVDRESKKITFLYKVQRGTGGESRGIYCARVAGIPEEIAAGAEKASSEFEKALAMQLVASKFCSISKALDEGDEAAVEALRNL